MEIVKDQQEGPSYDPNKKYKWTPEDPFTFSGNEFGVLLNALRAILSTPDAQRVLLADKANDIVENALARAVESGVVKEAPEEEPKNSL